MKHFLHPYALQAKHFIYVPLVVITLFITGCCKNSDLPAVKVTTVATGLQAPMGIETDMKGNLWVAETGTTNDDGKVVVITPGHGKGEDKSMTYDAIIHLSSIKNVLSGEAEGPANLLLDNTTLYILAGDYLYSANVGSFKPGDKPIDAKTLPRENIGNWVRSLNIVTPNDSHPFNLIKGPDGNLYIVDAGANAIIKRKGAGSYSVFAKFPDLKNPTTVGPPMIQSVPTGIIVDGNSFLVSTLTGFPFLDNEAVIYRVSMSGNVSVYQKGFTTLTGIAAGSFYGHVVLHYASFGATGFNANTGSLLLTDGTNTRVITSGLNMPSGIKQTNHQSWYVSSLPDGKVVEISYIGHGN